jgi:hypothetical protein
MTTGKSLYLPTLTSPSITFPVRQERTASLEIPRGTSPLLFALTRALEIIEDGPFNDSVPFIHAQGRLQTREEVSAPLLNSYSHSSPAIPTNGEWQYSITQPMYLVQTD